MDMFPGLLTSRKDTRRIPVIAAQADKENIVDKSNIWYFNLKISYCTKS